MKDSLWLPTYFGLLKSSTREEAVGGQVAFNTHVAINITWNVPSLNRPLLFEECLERTLNNNDENAFGASEAPSLLAIHTVDTQLHCTTCGLLNKVIVHR